MHLFTQVHVLFYATTFLVIQRHKGWRCEMRKLGLEFGKWFPSGNSWLNALMLSVLMTGFAILIKNTGGLGNNLNRWSQTPELSTVIFIFLLVIPIPLISLLHHFAFSKFISSNIKVDSNSPEGFLPGLTSWRIALYSWIVFLLSTLIAILFCTPLLPIFSLNYKKILFDFTPDSNLQILFVFFWLISAAGLYQIEYLFNKLILSRYLQENTGETDKVIVPTQVIVGTSATSDYVTQQQIQENNTTRFQSNKLATYRNLPKKILTFLIIMVGSIWVYMFINLPQVKETMYVNQATYQSSTQTATENSVSESEKSTKKVDSFEAATKKADSALRLMKIAQSPEEWTLVVNQWEDAIALMKEVPARHPNYGLATQKVRDYQLHLQFAKQYGAE